MAPAKYASTAMSCMETSFGLGTMMGPFLGGNYNLRGKGGPWWGYYLDFGGSQWLWGMGGVSRCAFRYIVDVLNKLFLCVLNKLIF